MVDVQIVAGGRHELVFECLRRVREEEGVAHLWLADNTGSLPLDDDDDLTIVRNAEPATFEVNHNRLAKLGVAPYILFLDDDSFLFKGTVNTLLDVLQSQPDVAAAGGVNNQTFPLEQRGRRVPVRGSLEDFLAHQSEYEEIARSCAQRFEGEWLPRLFLPGNMLLVRRKVWQKRYGGWFEGYRNWNEEVDFIGWCFEQGMRVLCSASVWFYHCGAQSRDPERSAKDVAASAHEFLHRWPEERATRLLRHLSSYGHAPLAEEWRTVYANNVRSQQSPPQ